MSALAVSVVAWGGVYLYVALFYGALYWLRQTQREYLVFAALCVGLSVYSIASGAALAAPNVAAAVGAQHLQFVGLLAATGFFVDFALRLADARHVWLLRVSYAIALAGAGASLARLFFDPAYANESYDFAAARVSDPATADLTPIGMAYAGASVVFGGYAVVRLFMSARGKKELRIAAALTALGVCLGAVDLVRSAIDLAPLHLSAHGALLPVIAFSYVLIGRFTHIDAQLADRTKKLAQSYDHLRFAQEEIVKKEQLAAVGELSAVIAHEVRNPLAIIKNAVGGLRRSELPPDDAETLLRILDEETDRLNRLVNDLLAYAKPISPEAGSVDLRTLVAHAVELAAGGNRDISHIEIELALDQPTDPVEGDEALLRHALINIVDNALQAMPTGGTLAITCRNTQIEGRAAVAVDFQDTGEGMDTLVRSKARDPFFTTRQTGTGLGLAIVDRVARVHGGVVEIESRHGMGTKVSFIVPRVRTSMTPTSS
jgi:signal transduction histidine kinase